MRKTKVNWNHIGEVILAKIWNSKVKRIICVLEERNGRACDFKCSTIDTEEVFFIGAARGKIRAFVSHEIVAPKTKF